MEVQHTIHQHIMALRKLSQLTACCSSPISLDATSHPSDTVHLQLWVLHFMLRLVEFRFKEAVCDSQRSIGHEKHGELELGDKFT